VQRQQGPYYHRHARTVAKGGYITTKAQECYSVSQLCERIKVVTGQNLKVTFFDQEYTDGDTKFAVAVNINELSMIKKPESWTGLMLLASTGPLDGS